MGLYGNLAWLSTLKLKNCGFPIQAKNYKLIVYYDVSLCVHNTDGFANRTIFLSKVYNRNLPNTVAKEMT